MKNTSNEIKDVLFQKLGNHWYAITEVNGEAFFTTLPPGINPTESKFDVYKIIEEQISISRPEVRRYETVA